MHNTMMIWKLEQLNHLTIYQEVLDARRKQPDVRSQIK